MKTNCVTKLQKESAEYKAAMQRFNMTSGDLELILQAYQSLPENQEAFSKGELPFPSNEYLQEHFYAPVSTVTDSKVIDFWDKQYSSPIITNTYEEAATAQKEASKYFDPKSMVIKETNDGKYQLLVSRPKMDYGEEGNQILKNAKKDEKGRLLAPNGKVSNLSERQYVQVRTKAFKNWFGDWEKTAPITQASIRLIEKLEEISKSDSQYAKLATTILENNALPINLKYFHIDNNRNDVEGHEAMWNSLVSIIEVLGNQVSEAEIHKVLLHELIHYNTEELLTKYKENPNNVPTKIRHNIEQLYSIIGYTKKYILDNYNTEKFAEIAKRQNLHLGSKLFYAFNNQHELEIDEFISELFTNPGFQEVLNSIPFKESKVTIWDKIKECIESIFGFTINKGSVLEEALKASSDFIKQNDDVSKVVDENGEPLVVYHGSSNIFNTFDYKFFGVTDSGDLGKGFYFAYDKQVSENYGNNIYPVFLNIRNPFIHTGINTAGIVKFFNRDYNPTNREYLLEQIDEIKSKIELYTSQLKEYNDDFHLRIINKKLNYYKALLENTEGDFKNKSEDFLNAKKFNIPSDEYDGVMEKNEHYQIVAKNSNQVKSAESNTGTFDINNDNIYYNLQQSKSPKDTIYEILRKEGLIHRWGNGDKYMLTLKADVSYGSNNDLNHVTREQLVNRAFDRVKARLEELGLPTDLIEKKDSYSQGTAFVSINEDKITKIKDAIDAGAKLGDIKAIYDLTDFLSKKFGVEFGGIITAKKANEMTGGMNANAFISHNKVYVVANKVTVDTVAEEFLHPFVNTIYKQTPEKFNELYKEACELFPSLKLQIENAYGKNKKRFFTKEDLRQELVTQALSRNFREEYEKSLKDGKLSTEETLKRIDKVTAFFTKFWNYIKDLLASIKDRTYNDAVNFTVEDLQEFSLNELAKIINARDSAFLIEHNDKTRFNINDKVEWSRQSSNDYEVSTAGDSRFSALKATFKEGTVIDGVDVSGMTIEDVYQKVIKKSKKGQPPAKDSKLYNQNSNLSKEKLEDMSYEKGYLPLWQEWAKQNPDLIEDLRQKAAGKVLTDKFANTKVSQARALAEILNQSTIETAQEEISDEDTVREKETIHPIDSLTQKINNITSIDSPISATEANELARKIAYKLSDILTEVQNDPELAETVTDGLVKAKDITDEDLADRMKLLQKLGIRRVLNFCRDEVFSYEYDDETGEGRNPNITEEMFDKADLLYDNFDALVQLGIAEFASVEGFGIKLDSEGNAKAEEVDNNEVDANENDKETAIENGENTQESWQVDTNTIDVVQSMSQIVKRALMQCYRMNPDGSFQVNDWGLYDRIDIRETTNSILKWVQGSINYKTMVEKLVKQSEKNPWLKQILPRLLDESGNETVFQSQFYGVMMKHQQLYDVIRTKDGEISSVPVNSTPALTDAKRTIASKFKMGNHPLFDSTGKVNQKTKQDLLKIKDNLEHKKYSEETREEIVQNIYDALTCLGYDTDINSVDAVVDEKMFNNTTDILGYIYKDLETHQNDTEWEPFSTNSKKNGILNNIGKLIKPITDNVENLIPSSFYANGKMYQTYITPSYMTKMFQNFRLPNEIDMNNPNEATPFNAWLEKEFGMTEWFKQTPSPNSINANERATQGWRNLWLRELATNPNAAKIIAHKVNLNYNGNSYMNNKSGRAMSPAEYTLSIITEYFRETTDNKESKVPAWFRVPMMSNKPSSEFIKFYSYRGVNYKDEILNGMMMIFNQELSRIQTVILRNETYGKGSDVLIKNFDAKRGKEFCFLDFLEKHRKDKKGNLTEFGKLIDDKVNGKEINEAKLLEMAKELIMQELNEEVQRTLEKWRNNSVLKAAEKIQGIDKAHVKEDLENFILNDALANMNMTQLLITDKAYYKNTEDEQKRMAQVHAPGIRPNVDATDFSGKRVSDGVFRTIILKDFDKYKSNIIDNLRVVFNKKLEKLDKNSKQYALQKEVYDNILKQYEEINVADAEGYSSPTSLRKKMYMFGKWNKHHENIYQKIRSGKYDYKDLEFAFQPLKPFVFSSSMVSSRVDDAPIKTMKVNYQYKNSEYLLMMADAIIRNENTGKPNLLKVLYDVMEGSASTMGKEKCIDTIQFESTTKTGLSAPIDLSMYIEDKDGEANAKALIEGLIYQDDDKKTYNTVYVKESDFSDYCIQQEVPEHFKDHTQAHGSQIRMITPSDLNPDALYRVEDRNVSPTEFRNEYENTIAEGIEESIKSLSDELHLTGTRYERNVALSNILKKEILSSPRYGVDLLLACSLDENGEFRIPLGDPIQSKRVEQLINSIVKNRVNKQKIAGGPVVQVSNFGTSRQLNIRFKDKDGNLLKTKEEFGGTQEEFDKYIEENQNGIAYYEVFAPIYTDELLQFMDENGNIDVEAVEKTSPELLDIVTYRIPSEDKYSSAPCKIVGFMPREAGEGIMMPYEITTITGSDYDVDKMYIMRKDIPIFKKEKKEIREILIKELGNKKRDDINIFLDQVSAGQIQEATSNYPDIAKVYRNNAFKAIKPTKGRSYRNNKIIDMTLEVLRHPETTAQVLNPGGFEPQKRMGYMVTAYKTGRYSWNELQKMSTDDLKDACYEGKNLSFIDTQIQFYGQNSVAGSILAIFAVAKTAHATLENNRFIMNLDTALGTPGMPIRLGNYELSGRVEIDPTFNLEGEYVGKILGSLVASAADAVKDPVLNLMNINVNTVNILNAAIRIGIPFETVAMLLSTNTVTKVLDDLNVANLDNFTSLTQVIKGGIEGLTNGATTDNRLFTEKLSEEEMLSDINGRANPNVQVKILNMLLQLNNVATALKGVSGITRFNSMASAVGPLVIDNLMLEEKMRDVSLAIEYPYDEPIGTIPITNEVVLNMHPILKQFSRTLDMAHYIFGNDSPVNSNSFRAIMDELPSTVRRKLYRDRKLFSKFSDFYQSYVMMLGGVINMDDSKAFIDDFPQAFLDRKYKEKYKDNFLIQSIKVNVDEKTKRPVLRIDTTGLDQVVKDKLSNAWIDLYNSGEEGKKLSFSLFKYNFFKGGIGFSPKTFTNLLPVQLKELIPNYTSTFRKLPTVPDITTFIDQFVQNYCNEPGFLPKRKVDTENLIAGSSLYMKDYFADYFLSSDGNMLFKKTDTSMKEGYPDGSYYMAISMLGNNGEFIEMSKFPIMTPMKLKEREDSKDTFEITEYNPQENIQSIENKDIVDVEYEEVTEEITAKDRERIEAVQTDMLNELFGEPMTTEANKKSVEKGVAKVLKENDIKVSQEELDKEVKKFC